MTDKELLEFLKKSKVETYANANSPKEDSTRIASHDYEYKKDNLTYHDTYFGGIKFIGEEVVYIGDIPIWGMNYNGITLDETLTEETVDKALRPALMRVGEDDTVLPLRGPSKFENDGYTYTFTNQGDINDFTGVEEIKKGNKLVYKLNCHGSRIK